jgi:hypothetical protein
MGRSCQAAGQGLDTPLAALACYSITGGRHPVIE